MCPKPVRALGCGFCRGHAGIAGLEELLSWSCVNLVGRGPVLQATGANDSLVSVCSSGTKHVSTARPAR